VLIIKHKRIEVFFLRVCVSVVVDFKVLAFQWVLSFVNTKYAKSSKFIFS